MVVASPNARTSAPGSPTTTGAFSFQQSATPTVAGTASPNQPGSPAQRGSSAASDAAAALSAEQQVQALRAQAERKLDVIAAYLTDYMDIVQSHGTAHA